MKKKLIMYGIVILAILIIYYLYRKRNIIKNKQVSLTLYYSPECTHCHAFMPIWDEIYKKSDRIGINMKKVDCQKDKCDGIEGVPTIMLTKLDGSQIVYDGKRTEIDLEKFISVNK